MILGSALNRAFVVRELLDDEVLGGTISYICKALSPCWPRSGVSILVSVQAVVAVVYHRLVPDDRPHHLLQDHLIVAVVRQLLRLQQSSQLGPRPLATAPEVRQ